MTETTETAAKYFGREVTVWKIPGKHPYPWRFKIKDGDITRIYVGIPNYCETRASGLRRAWWRCRWLADGTYLYRNHYYVR